MASITKSLSSKVIQGKSQVLLRITLNRNERIRIKSSVFVTPDLFDNNTGDIKIPQRGKYFDPNRYNEAVMAKSELDEFMSRIWNIIATGRPNHLQITKEWIEEVMELQDNPKINLMTQHLTINKIEEAKKEEEEEAQRSKDNEFINAIDTFLAHKRLGEGRKMSYKVLQRMVKRFILYKRELWDKDYNLFIDTMSIDDIEEFRYFVRNEAELAKTQRRIFKKIEKECPLASNPDKPRTYHDRGENYVISIMKRVKAVANWYEKMGLTTNRDIKRLEVGQDIYGTPYYINREERDTIADYDLSAYPKHIQEQRDIFIFQCLIGCRVGDLIKLTDANIYNGILEYVPTKTKDHTQQVKPRIPLYGRALDLIAKYKGVDKKGRLFPFESPNKYNEQIRKIFRICGINRNVIVRNSVTGENELKPLYEVATSHMARRTFIGAAYKLVKDPNLIGAMSGHAPGSKAFNRYRAIDDEDLKSLVARM